MTIDYHALQERAIVNARHQSTHGPAFPVNSCLLQCRTVFGISQRIDTATDSWRASKDQHTKTALKDIPRGVPVYWTGGSTGAGHIAISVGNGRCLSTDISRHGFFDEVPITEINRRWGSKLRFVGWSETLNGVRVWEKPAEPRKPPTPTPVHNHVVKGRQLLAEAVAELRKASKKRTGVWSLARDVEDRMNRKTTPRK